tara:strand:+ start:4845 stop:6044 length:1200 start_codon:yes stop_codon:yes gene_type:complete
MKKTLNIILFITIAVSTLYISFDQPQTITSNDAVIHCEIMAPTIKNGLNPYIHENLVISDTREEKKDSISNTPFNHIPTLNGLLLILCNETKVNWVNLYPYILFVIFCLAILFISTTSIQPAYYSLFFISFGNGVYQSIRSGNLSSFAFLFLVIACYMIDKDWYLIGGAFYGIYILYRMTPLVVVILILFILKNKKARQFLIGFSSIFVSSLIYSSIFQTVLLKDWFLRVVLPESLSNRINPALSEGRQMWEQNILGDYFDIPSVLNFIHYFNSLSIFLGIGISIFTLYSLYKILLSIDRFELNLEIFLVLNLVHLAISPYFRSYHIIELAFIATILIAKNNEEFPLVYWIFPTSFYLSTYLRVIEINPVYTTVLHDLAPPLLLLYLFSQYSFGDKLKS